MKFDLKKAEPFRCLTSAFRRHVLKILNMIRADHCRRYRTRMPDEHCPIANDGQIQKHVWRFAIAELFLQRVRERPDRGGESHCKRTASGKIGRSDQLVPFGERFRADFPVFNRYQDDQEIARPRSYGVFRRRMNLESGEFA